MGVKEIVYEHLYGYKASLKSMNINDSTTFDQLGFDSIDKLEMLMAIEDKFGVTFPEDLQVAAMGELIAKIEELKK